MRQVDKLTKKGPGQSELIMAINSSSDPKKKMDLEEENENETEIGQSSNGESIYLRRAHAER